ncbi:MAG: DUF1796 family putative cysteine peptidase [Scandinavium sp.]|uniref:DUF1796 family putative cysteine peptidase n=1 Tax=Scandinavium sp. TaxID=2830653 RepID=UPI003F2E24D4
MKKTFKNKLKSAKRTLSNFTTKIRHRANFSADVLWLSIGENCLTDDILRRHHRKSYSHVFSSSRSNIEYVLQMEQDNYRYLLPKEHLVHCIIDSHEVIRSGWYKTCANIYSPRHMEGFEFSHHNPLDVEEDRRAFKRRIARTLEIRGKKNVVFAYHHRLNERSDLAFIREKLNTLIDLYNNDDVNCQIVFFYQQLINESEQSRLAFFPSQSGLLEFVCHSKVLWGGEDQTAFWAKSDDDLFAEMFATVDAWRRFHQRHNEADITPS